MFSRIMSDPSLPVILSRIDSDFAREARSGGCPHCGGRLHSARYPRKPRCDRDLGPSWSRRFSFCCAEEGCRRRTTPPSVRFLGRRVYPVLVVVLVSALCQGVTGSRFRRISSILAIDRRTLERWRRWWRETCPRTRFFRQARSLLLPPVDDALLPGSLLERFGKGSLEGIVSLLRFLAPGTVSSGLFEGAK